MTSHMSQLGLDPNRYPHFFNGEPIKYEPYSYVKVYMKVSGMEEEEINLITVAAILVLCAVMIAAMFIKNCCWRNKKKGENRDRKDSYTILDPSAFHIYENLDEITYLDDSSRYVSCMTAYNAEEEIEIKPINKASRPLATNDVIVNTSGVQRLRILRRHNTEPAIKKPPIPGSAGFNNLKPFSKITTKRKDRKRVQKLKLESLSEKYDATLLSPQSALGNSTNPRSPIRPMKSSLIEPPIWMLAEEDFDVSQNSSTVQVQQSNSDESSPTALSGQASSVKFLVDA